MTSCTTSGCNDGRVCVAAALERGARSVGIEIDPGACAVARERAARANALVKKDLVRVEEASAFDASASEATVVFSYLLPKGNAKLGAKLLRELKPGSRVVTYLFKMPERDVGREVDARGEFRELARASVGRRRFFGVQQAVLVRRLSAARDGADRK